MHLAFASVSCKSSLSLSLEQSGIEKTKIGINVPHLPHLLLPSPPISRSATQIAAILATAGLLVMSATEQRAALLNGAFRQGDKRHLYK